MPTLTEKQLTALGFLAVDEGEFSSKELAGLMEMNKSNFSRTVLNPLIRGGWIKIEKSPATYKPGRPKEILKITKDISKIYEILPLLLTRIKICEIKKIEILREANEQLEDVDFEMKIFEMKKIETRLEFYEHLDGIFYELRQNLIREMAISTRHIPNCGMHAR